MGTITPLDQIKRFEVTEVYAHPEATIDIVLVHGLNGDPRNTWTAKNGVFWPSALLPVTLRLAKVRILVYGYNADVYTFGNSRSASSDMLHQHAQSLLTGLSMERMSEEKDDNAIIWVAHSLGGILVKRALELSNDLTSKSSDPSRSIYVSTYGIIFLGTPHLGADGAKWGQILEALVHSVLPKKAVDTEDQLLKTLKSNNETLQNINLHFMDIYQRFEIDMVHEAVKTDFKGTRAFVVDQASAGLQLPGVRYYGIEATHSGMCKFESKNAPGYLNVSMAIKGWVKDCSPLIQARWNAERKSRKLAKEDEARELLGDFPTYENLMSPPAQGSLGNTPALSNSGVIAPSMTNSSTLLEPDAAVPTAPFIKPPGFRPNSLFVGRADELDKMHKKLFDKRRRAEGVATVLLQCIPGGGKTHLAREYVYKHLKDFPGGVFWVTAKSQEQLEAGFWRIAESVALKPSKDNSFSRDTEDFVQCVNDWFTTHHEWLLVLDGIHFNHSHALQRFIPDSTNSSLIYTSTERNVGGDHHFMNPQVIRLPLLSAREAQELFLKEIGMRNPTTDDLSEAMKLVQRMGFLPEVIHVAAKRLKSTEEPLAKFARSYANGPKLRALDTYVAVREQLKNAEAHEALNLINILSFFSGNIPVEMIALGLKAVDLPLKAYEPVSGHSLNNTFKVLNTYALINRSHLDDISSHSSQSSRASSKLLDDDLDVLRIHSVVQDFFTDSLRAAGTTALWLARAIALLTRSYDQATARIKAKTSAGLVSDYRSYQIHARRLLDHLTRLEKKGPPVNPSARESLDAALRNISEEIVRRTRQSSLDIAKGGDAFHISIFDRTSSSSDTGPETPGLYDCYPPGASLWGPNTKQLESPLSTGADFPLKFPAMPSVDPGYDTDRSSDAGTSVPMHSSQHSATSVLPPPPVELEIAQEPDGWQVVPPYRTPRDPFRASYRERAYPRAPTPHHRTTGARAPHRYYTDSAGAFQPSTGDPRVSLSTENARGVLLQRGGSGRPVSRGRAATDLASEILGMGDREAEGRLSGRSAAEVELCRISKTSPPPGRGGGLIQDRRRPSQRPWELLGGAWGGGTRYSDAVAGDTLFTTATSSPMSASPPTEHPQPQPRSSSKPSPRPRFATPAMASLQRIPSHAPPSSPPGRASPPEHREQRIQGSPPSFYMQPYPMSATDVAARAYPARVYPRQTGPLPIEYFASAAPLPLSLLYPHAPGPGPAAAPFASSFPHPQAPYPPRSHVHAAGYSSAPMSRDASGQSGRSVQAAAWDGGRPPSVVQTEPGAALRGFSPSPPGSAGRRQSPRMGMRQAVEMAVARRQEGRFDPAATVFEPRPVGAGMQTWGKPLPPLPPAGGRRVIEFGELGEPVDWGRKREESGRMGGR